MTPPNIATADAQLADGRTVRVRGIRGVRRGTYQLVDCGRDRFALKNANGRVLKPLMSRDHLLEHLTGDRLDVEGTAAFRWQIEDFRDAGNLFWNVPFDQYLLAISAPQAGTARVSEPASLKHYSSVLLKALRAGFQIPQPVLDQPQLQTLFLREGLAPLVERLRASARHPAPPCPLERGIQAAIESTRKSL